MPPSVRRPDQSDADGIRTGILMAQTIGQIAKILSIDSGQITYDMRANQVRIPRDLADRLLALIPGDATVAEPTPEPAPKPAPATAAEYLARRFDDGVDRVAARLRDLTEEVETTGTRAVVAGSSHGAGYAQAAGRIMHQVHSALPTLGLDSLLDAAVTADTHATQKQD